MVDGMSDMGTTELGAASTPEQARAAFRDGLVRPTCGIAQGYAQANLMILPKEQAFDFCCSRSAITNLVRCWK